MNRWLFTPPQWSLATRALDVEGYPSPIQVNLGLGGAEKARWLMEDRGELRDGRLAPDLEDALRVLARPERSVDAVWLPASRATLPMRVLAAQAGNSAVIAVQTPEAPGATSLVEIPARSLVAAMIGELPGAPPGKRPAVTVPARQPRAREPVSPGGVLTAHSPALSRAERDWRAATEVTDVPHRRTGQIGANVRRRAGGELRSEVLRWFDNDGDGRYLMSIRHERGEQQWLVAPADATALGEHTTQLLEGLSARR